MLADCDKLLTRNRIFFDRMVGIGVISREDAISYGLTGPLLRATGVAYDVRKAQPVPRSTTASTSRCRSARSGDNYDRFLVRFDEIEQSMRIVEQALRADARRARSRIDDPRYVLPPKQRGLQLASKG